MFLKRPGPCDPGPVAEAWWRGFMMRLCVEWQEGGMACQAHKGSCSVDPIPYITLHPSLIEDHTVGLAYCMQMCEQRKHTCRHHTTDGPKTGPWGIPLTPNIINSNPVIDLIQSKCTLHTHIHRLTSERVYSWVLGQLSFISANSPSHMHTYTSEDPAY